jgi:hypothetical protein
MHERDSVFTGKTLLDYRDLLKQAISLRRPFTLLDYGCGKGQQYAGGGLHEEWDYDGVPTLYDPCYAPFAKKPSGTYDGVICTDVLEHVPEDYLSRVIQDIFDYAVDFVFIGVSTRLAIKKLPNGNNTHSTVKPIEWWGAKIDKYNLRNIKVYLTSGR